MDAFEPHVNIPTTLITSFVEPHLVSFSFIIVQPCLLFSGGGGLPQPSSGVSWDMVCAARLRFRKRSGALECLRCSSIDGRTSQGKVPLTYRQGETKGCEAETLEDAEVKRQRRIDMRQRLMTAIRQVSGSVCLLSTLISPRHLLSAFVLRDSDVRSRQSSGLKTKKTVQVCLIRPGSASARNVADFFFPGWLVSQLV